VLLGALDERFAIGGSLNYAEGRTVRMMKTNTTAVSVALAGLTDTELRALIVATTRRRTSIHK
jgi:hypothetical protein